MKRKNSINQLLPSVKIIAMLIGAVLLAWLAYSVAISGLMYQFDIDEFFFAQNTYLYAHHFRPYLDVYTSVYPPIFFWITMPVFTLTGFTMPAMYTARYVMIFLLAIRLLYSWKALRLIFSKRTALLFLPLFLFNPFSVFTMMQYRPDNLMLTLLSIGLYYFASGIIHKKIQHISIAGFVLSLSLLTLSKVVPTIFSIGLVFTIYCVFQKKFHLLFPFLFWAIVPVATFCVYLIYQGSFGAMIQQTFIDINALYTSFSVPLPYNTMFHPDNAFIFGVMGKPATWVYLWLIAPMGLMGAYHMLHSFLISKSRSTQQFVQLMLGLAFVGQWAALFVVQVAFIQHYMPFHWLAIMFMAYAIDELLLTVKDSPSLRFIFAAVCIAIILYLTKVSIPNNILRSTITGEYTNLLYTNRWKEIPPNEAVFPGFLFRPPTYPLPYGGFIINKPKSVLDTLPNIATMLATKKPRLLLDEYTLVRLPDDVQIYISENYTRVVGDPELMVHK